MAAPESNILRQPDASHMLRTGLPMKVTPYLLVTAIVEIGAGLALLIVPNAVSAWLLGAASSDPASLFLARWVGVALLAIGVASGLAREDAGGPARRGVLVAVVFYDVAAVLLLISATLGPRLAGPALWPAVVLHTLLAGWGGACFLAARTARPAGAA
ncbi:MAG TPA: hypothetical protein VFU81_01820 [Thermomicrobiales bacterium]|nr:hypothetical protein [Thermomicrobiales bacterium]